MQEYLPAHDAATAEVTYTVWSVRDYIDRLRGTFALLVMLGHAMDVAYARPVDYWAPLLLPYRQFLGFVWVVGFIVLSGYCIARSCMRAGRDLTPGGYTALRASRLFPLLWICLGMTIVFETIMLGSPHRPDIWNLGIDSRTAILNIFGLGGFYGRYGSIAPAYTLSYELLFYACWAVGWFASGARPGRALWLAIATIPALWALELLLPGVLKPPFAEFVRILFVCWLAGAALAVYLERWAATAVARAIAPFRWPVLFAVLLWGGRYLLMPQTSASSSAWLYFPTLACAFVLVIVGYAAQDHPGSRMPRLDRALGVLSYPVFLAHGPALMFTGYLLNRSGTTLEYGPFLVVLLLSGLAISTILALLVERPVMALRARVRNRRKARQTGEPTEAQGFLTAFAVAPAVRSSVDERRTISET